MVSVLNIVYKWVVYPGNRQNWKKKKKKKKKERKKLKHKAGKETTFKFYTNYGISTQELGCGTWRFKKSRWDEMHSTEIPDLKKIRNEIIRKSSKLMLLIS